MRSLLSTRVLIPVCLLVLVTTALTLDYITSARLDKKQILDSRTLTLKNTLNYVQSSTELFLSLSSNSQIQQAIASFAAEKDIVVLFITDPAGNIIAATDIQSIGKHWSQIDRSPTPAMVSQVSANRQSRVVSKDDNQILAGMTQICNFANSGLLRPRTCGVLYIEVDLAYHLSQSQRSQQNGLLFSGAGTIMAAIIMLLILTVSVTNRARDIIHNINRFKAGNRLTRITTRGNNELTSLSHSINELFEKIQDDEKSINEKRTRYASLIDTMADGLITICVDGTIESMNLAAEKLLGYQHNELIGSNISLLTTDQAAKDPYPFLNSFIGSAREADQASDREVQAIRKDGSHFPIRLSISKMEIDGETLFSGLLSDISRIKAMEKELRGLNSKLSLTNKSLEKTVITDSLTSLFNRRHFDATFKKELARSTRQRTSLSLIVADIDFFKQYNDRYGHALGDECLTNVAACIKGIFKRSGDMPARYGGEEFAIILPGCDGLELQERAEALRIAIIDLQVLHAASKIEKVVTISIGAVTYRPTSKEVKVPRPRELFIEADKALYRAKARGRNQIVFAGHLQPLALPSEPVNVLGPLAGR